MIDNIVGDDEDVIKHAKVAYVQGDKVDGFAFLPRPLPKDVDGSSVNRVILLGEDIDKALVELRKVFRLELKKGHRFATINIGDLRVILLEKAGVDPMVVADPLPAVGDYAADISHALIKGLPQPTQLDNLIGDMLMRAIKHVGAAIE